MKKLLSQLSSVKFQIIVLASYFFQAKTLSETGWITVILAFGGFRTVNELAGMFKDYKKGDS